MAVVAVYAGLGVGIDALIPAKQTIYVGGGRASVNRIKVKPLVDKSRKGIAVAFSF